MSITIYQLNQLATKFCFDIGEAREFLGLPQANNRGRPQIIKANKSPEKKKPKVCDQDDVSKKRKINDKPIEKPDDKPDKKMNEKETQSKRGPSGYNLYMASVHAKITKTMKANLADGEKLARGAVIGEIGATWSGMSDKEKAVWNKKAADMKN